MAGREKRDGFIYGKPDTQGFLTGRIDIFIPNRNLSQDGLNSNSKACAFIMVKLK